MNTIEFLERADGKPARWRITAAPHIIQRAKRIFPKILASEHDHVHLTDNLDNARDLWMLCDRYDFDLDDDHLLRLQATAEKHQQLGRDIQKVITGTHVPHPTKLEMQVTPREYQNTAADLCATTGRLLLGDMVGLGKDQPIDAKVLTPHGWREIGSLREHDWVIGSDGYPTEVTGTYPQGVKPTYRVTFTDGSSVEAGEDHLWTVRYFKGGKKWTNITLKTKQLLETKYTYYLPMLSAPVRFNQYGNLQPLDPYLLGLLIANGTMKGKSAQLSCNTADSGEVLQNLINRRVLVGSTQTYGNNTRMGIRGVMPAVRELGLAVGSIDKFIPTDYLQGEPEDRIALLQGLMDGDGSASASRNRVTYHSCSLELASGVRDLVEGLGGIATLRTYDRTKEDKGLEYQVRVRLPLHISPFTVSRKANRLTLPRRVPQRTVQSVTYSREVDSVCISVGAADQLYATEHCILTHNTISSITMLAKTGAFPCLLVVPTHMPTQWKGQLDRCLPGLYVHILKSGQAKPWKKGRIPDVIISNYHKLHGWAQALTPHIKSIIFDEVQELRHHGSDKYKAAEHLAHNSTAQYRMGLSATPIHNYGGEMFNVLNILEEGCLGDRFEFYREYCSSMNGKQLIRDPSAFGTYLRDTGLMLRRTRAEVGRELEDLQNIIIDVEVDMDCIKAVEDISVKLARILTNPSQWRGDKMHAGGELSYKLREATGLAKAKFVADFVTTLVESGEKVLLYGWHRKVYTEWKLLLHQFNPAFYTGKESTTVKEHELGRFLDPEGDCQVMIMSLRSGQGVDGIQFVCSTVVYGEIDWSPAVHIQGTGRAHRDGQPNPVIAYYPLADVGSDPVVSDTLGVKKAQLVGIVDPHFTPVEHTDPNHMRKLALSILKQRGEHIDPFLEMEILSDG